MQCLMEWREGVKVVICVSVCMFIVHAPCGADADEHRRVQDCEVV